MNKQNKSTDRKIVYPRSKSHLKITTFISCFLNIIIISSNQTVYSNTYNKDLIRFLSSGKCTECLLININIVNSDFTNAELRGSNLQHSNLSGSRFIGGDFRDTNLTNVSFAESSLRGSDLRGAILNGTDFSNCDLTNTIFDYGAIIKAHWEDSIGIDIKYLSKEELYDAGVRMFYKNKYKRSEELFTKSLYKDQSFLIAFIGRAATKLNQADIDGSILDLKTALNLIQEDDIGTAFEIEEYIKKLEAIKREELKARNQGKVNSFIGLGVNLMRLAGPGLLF